MPTFPEDGLYWGVLDRTLAGHKEMAACFLMSNCQNPLGFSMPEEKMRELVKLPADHRVPPVENGVNIEL